MRRLPKMIFVRWEDAPNDAPYLMAMENVRGESGRFGVYVLREEYDVRQKTQVRRKKTRRWFDKSDG